MQTGLRCSSDALGTCAIPLAAIDIVWAQVAPQNACASSLVLTPMPRHPGQALEEDGLIKLMPETNARCVLRTANDILARLAPQDPLAKAILNVASVCFGGEREGWGEGEGVILLFLILLITGSLCRAGY